MSTSYNIIYELPGYGILIKFHKLYSRVVINVWNVKKNVILSDVTV